MELRKRCEHEVYDEHAIGNGVRMCPGGEFASLDDLIAAINRFGVEGTVRVSYIGSELVSARAFYIDDTFADD